MKKNRACNSWRGVCARLLTGLIALILLTSAACNRNTAPSAGTTGTDRTIFRTGLIQAEQATLEGLPGASEYRLDVQIGDDLTSLKGQEQVYYTNREEQTLNAIYFQLFPNMAGGGSKVSAVKVNGQAVEPIYEAGDASVSVPLSAPLQPGQSLTIEMNFEVQVPAEVGGNYGLFGYLDHILVLDGFYPAIPVYDAKGWHAGKTLPNADTTFQDASFYVVKVTAPASLTFITSGVQVESATQDDHQVVTFAVGPARDFYMAASDRLVVKSATVGETKVNSYAFEERGEGAQLALDTAVNTLKSFNERFGTYPYTEFDVVSTPMQGALGIEYPGIIGINYLLYDLSGEVNGIPAAGIFESIVAHEAGHQWFYNVVGNDQTNEPWLDEAVAQYITGLYFLDQYGQDAMNGIRTSWQGRWSSVDQQPIPIGLPAGSYEGAEYGAIVYGRGPLFVEALAQKLGQSTFDQFLRNYYQTNKWDIGTAAAFKQTAEKECQCDLSSLFAEWFSLQATEAATPTSAPTNVKVSWKKNYGPGGSLGDDLLVAEDGELYIVGTTDIEGENGDIYLAKTDAEGEVLWEKTYGGDQAESARSIAATSDGNLLIGGATSSSGAGGSDLYLIKVDPEGNEIWSKTLGGLLDERDAIVHQMPDGGFILSGNVVDPNDVIADAEARGYGGYDGRSNVLVARLDADGNELWSQQFGDQNNAISTASIQASDGVVVLARLLRYPQPDDDLYLIKVGANGQEAWTRTWEQGTLVPGPLLRTSDGNYLISGWSRYAPLSDAQQMKPDFLFLKVDQEGQEIWMKTFGDPEMMDFSRSVAETPDGGYLVVTDSIKDLTGASRTVTALLKINAAGELLWQETIPTSGQHVLYRSLQQCPDGSYIVFGGELLRGQFSIFAMKVEILRYSG